MAAFPRILLIHGAWHDAAALRERIADSERPTLRRDPSAE